ncbi:MAG: hypothetical protein HY327_06810 [Chloroflexi bacterium]|nr:hypothetical protein [Chloroflexota bacterium]
MRFAEGIRRRNESAFLDKVLVRVNVFFPFFLIGSPPSREAFCATLYTQSWRRAIEISLLRAAHRNQGHIHKRLTTTTGGGKVVDFSKRDFICRQFVVRVFADAHLSFVPTYLDLFLCARMPNPETFS